MPTIRLQIISNFISYLGADTGTPYLTHTPPTKPSGLTIKREALRPGEQAILPAVFAYFEDGPPRPIGSNYGAPLTERVLNVALDLSAQAVNDVSSDEALDPILAWTLYQIFANESQGGLVNAVEELKTEWFSKEGDSALAKARIHLAIKYRTSRIDPSTRT